MTMSGSEILSKGRKTNRLKGIGVGSRIFRVPMLFHSN